jgi:hypothetical protein
MLPILLHYLAQVARAGRKVAFPPLGWDMVNSQVVNDICLLFYSFLIYSLCREGTRVHQTGNNARRKKYIFFSFYLYCSRSSGSNNNEYLYFTMVLRLFTNTIIMLLTKLLYCI